MAHRRYSFLHIRTKGSGDRRGFVYCADPFGSLQGRVRTKTVKKAARVLVEKYYTRLTHDFQTNKKIAEDVAIIPSKRLRNKIAGFATVRRICLAFSIPPSQFLLLNSSLLIPPAVLLCVCARENEREQRAAERVKLAI